MRAEEEVDPGLETCNKRKRHHLLRLMRMQRLRDEELNRALHAVMVFVYVSFNVFVFCLHVMGLWVLSSSNACGNFGAYMLLRAIMCGAFWPFVVLLQLLLPEFPSKSLCMGCLVMLYSLGFLFADAAVVPEALQSDLCVASLSGPTGFNLLGVVAACNMGCGGLNILLLFAYFLTVAFCE